MEALAERLATAAQHRTEDAALVAEALAALAPNAARAEATVAAARYLDTVDNDDGRRDRTIVDALAPLLEREAAFATEARYLDATRMLAEVALRHQQWSIASNALLVLDSRLGEDQVPPWVRSFRTKLFYRLDPDAAIADPGATLELLGPLDALDPQGTAVVREYLALARDRFRTPDADTARRRFLARASSAIEPLHPTVTDLWQQLVDGPMAEVADMADEDEAPSATPETVAPALPRRPVGPPPPKRSTAPEAASATPPQPPRSDATNTDITTATMRPDREDSDTIVPSEDLEATATEVGPGVGTPAVAPDAAAMAALEAQLEALRQRNAELTAQRDAAAAGFIQIDEPLETVTGDAFTLGRRHLLVLGSVQPSHIVLQGIAKQFGISKEQLVFETDYDKLTSFDLESLRYSHQCAGVLIGAVPHKMRNVGSATSAIELLRTGEGFPPSVPMYAGSVLKGTKTSFRQALGELRDQMRASGAPTVGRMPEDAGIEA